MASYSMSAVELFDVAGLVAVITGGGTGLGLMMAKALENNGATVYIVGRRAEVLRHAAKEHAKHGKIVPVQGDITDAADLARVVATVEAHGSINLLVNNAGIARSVLRTSDLALKPATTDSEPGINAHPAIRTLQEQLTSGGPTDFAEVFSVNVIAPYYVALAFLPLLEAGNRSEYAKLHDVSSQIITISSIHGLRHDRRISSVSYTLSKAACEHMGQILASMLAEWKIRSNIITPGLFPSEMTAPHINSRVVWEERIPAGRLGDAHDVGGLILFLASRAGAYVNGASHVIDGGWLDWS